MEERDYYEALQLHPSADHAMIVQAYWHLARKYKNAMDQDAFVEQALEELNRSFGVLGNPESRADYDRTLADGTRTPPDMPETKRVSIEVCFWTLPAWQGMLAATCAVALAAVALAAGARPLPVFCLAAASIVAALLVLPQNLLTGGGIPIRRRWKREVNAAELEKSTSQILARWRDTNTEHDMTPLIELSKSGKFPPRS